MKKTGFSIVLLVLLAGTASAQDVVRLTLADAVERAVENNRDLASARLEIENSDAQVDEAYANALPSVGLNARYTQNLKKQVFYFPMPPDYTNRAIEIGQNMDVSTELTVNQILYNQAVFTGVGTARTFQKVARQQLRARTADIVLSVRRAYASAQLAREVLRLNETLLANTQENYRSTAALYRAGLRPEFDAIRAEVQMANQDPAVVQARDNYRLAIDQLRLLLGMEDGVAVELADTLVRPSVSADAEPSLAEARRILEANNPTLQAISLGNDVAREVIAIRKADYLPTVSLFGTLRFNAQADRPADLDFHTIAFAGLNLSLNLFNGFRTDAQVKQAEIDLMQGQVALAQVSHALRTQLEATIRRVESARQRISVSDKTIAQAEKGYRIATASYKAGSGTQLQINDADLALAQARLNQLNAVYDHSLALAELEQLLGNRVELNGDGSTVTYSMR